MKRDYLGNLLFEGDEVIFAFNGWSDGYHLRKGIVSGFTNEFIKIDTRNTPGLYQKQTLKVPEKVILINNQRLLTLEQHSQSITAFKDNIKNGIMCPKCKNELSDKKEEGIEYNPPLFAHKNIFCDNKECDFKGQRMVKII